MILLPEVCRCHYRRCYRHHRPRQRRRHHCRCSRCHRYCHRCCHRHIVDIIVVIVSYPHTIHVYGFWTEDRPSFVPGP